MPSPFKCHGGKTPLDAINYPSHPQNHDHLRHVEPLSGGAFVRPEMPLRREVLPDLGLGVLRILTAPREKLDELVARRRDPGHRRETSYAARDCSQEAPDDLGGAVKALVLWPPEDPLRLAPAGKDGVCRQTWWAGLGVLPAASGRPQGVAVRQAPATRAVEGHDRPDTLLHADTPGLPSTRPRGRYGAFDPPGPLREPHPARHRG
jgi:hypothetical protein